ncbi:MAG TPA: glycosyltransferase family 2 protein [Vicinamibacterales bacterium]|jgi:cellulose synthase/poly-beta-1,6-N-acetylglucosamine synthase-like glycosyltransferase
MTVVALTTVFWVSVVLIGYSYIGYPVLMFLLARVRPNPDKADPAYRPRVSLVIAACNEEKAIRQKLENTLALDYSRELLQIIVAADGSTDRTADIVAEYADRGVALMHQPERRGKSAALDRAVGACTGEVLLFSDANTDYSRDAVLTMIRHFADPKVGGVSGRKIVLEDRQRAATQGETAYWGYESSLKCWESAVGSIVTADGEIFAMRRTLFGGLPSSIVHDDMYLTLQMIDAGYRVVYEPQATSAEYASKNLFDEFHLKVRYASAGYQIVSRFRQFFVPWPTWFGLEFASHKLLRWLAPFFLLGAFATSGALAARQPYTLIFVAQAAFYAAAGFGYLLRRQSIGGVLYFPLYFSVMNAAALYGFVRYFRSGQSPLWRKAER